MSETLKRCPLRHPKYDWQCGLWAGHDGGHSALIPSNMPWAWNNRESPPPPQTVTPDEDAEWLLRIAESKAGERVQFSRQAAARLSRIAARLRSPSDAR